jgi:thioredoxin-like negative regulator of GroEL
LKNALICLFSLATALAGGTLASEGHGEEVPWGDKPNEAFADSASSSSPIAVDFWAIWCAPCKLMEETTYRDQRVVRALSAFVPLKVDVDADPVYVERYRIEHFPTTLILDEDGLEITRLLGLVESDELLEVAEIVGSGYAAYREESARPDDPSAMESVADYLLRSRNAAGASKLLRRALKRLKAAPAGTVDRVRTKLGEAMLADGRAAAACKEFTRVAESTDDGKTRGRALAGVVRAERALGREERASAALERLRDDHPELAKELEQG